MQKSSFVAVASSALTGLIVLSGCVIAQSSLADTATPMPYRQVNVGEDYTSLGMTQVADAMIYLGGGVDATKLTVINQLSSPIKVVQQIENKVQEEVPVGGRLSLPSTQWHTSDVKNLYMQIDQGDTVYCTAANTTPDGNFKYNELVVPYKGGATLTISGAGCHWQSEKVTLPAVTLSSTASVINHLHLATNKYGILILTDNVSASDWDTLKGICPQYNNDPNQVLCTVTVSIAKGEYNKAHTATLPILVNNGLRTKSVPAVVNEHISATGAVTGPNYFQIGANSDDFNKETKIVDLGQYFVDPSVSNALHHLNRQQTEAKG